MRITTKQSLTALTLVVGIATLTGCSNNFFAKKDQVAAQPQTNRNVEMYGLEDMDHRVADHNTPDALVYIAPGYDKTKPIHLVVYNHGMMTDLKQVEETWKLSDAVKGAAPNTVLVAPEWAVNPHNLSAEAGKFHQPGYFKGLLEEVFSKVPELKGRSLNDVADIQLSSFSGGLYGLVSELEKNGIENKVTNVTLYDSLYRGNALDGWLNRHIDELASGKKQYHNFYFHTWPASVQQLHRVKQMLAAKKLSTNCLRCDLEDPHTIMPPEKVATRSIIFKNTMANIDDKFTGHMAAPKTYIPVALKALALRDQGYTEKDLRKQELAKRKLNNDGVRRYM